MPIDIKSKFINPEMTTDLELEEGLALKQSLSEKNQPNGYAGLDAQGKLLESQLPTIYETSEVIDGGSPSSIYLSESIDGGTPLMATQIKIRRGLSSEWTSANPTLALGEQGLETDTKKIKIGDGVTAWNSLAYFNKSISELDAAYEPKNTNIQAHIINSSNPHSVTKAQVGLSDVPNVDATLRSNHTGTQLASTISDFEIASQSAVVSQSITNSDTSHAPSSDVVYDALASEEAARIAVSDRVTDIENDYGVANGLATLDSAGKISTSMLPGTVLEYKGTWNASTNTPSLQNGSSANNAADAGHIYRVSVAGTVDFGAGNITFYVGDDVILSESLQWQRAPGGSLVVSVNGYQGDVVLTSEDIALTSSVAGASDVQHALENVISRSNHTGTQLAATISDFTSAVQAVTIDAAKIDGGVVSNAEFATLDGINTGTSIQAQIDGKEDTITGAATSILAIDLTPSRVVTSDASGKIQDSSISTTTLGYLDATSSIQTQINGKEPSITAGTTSQYFRGDKSFQTLDKTAVGLGNVDNISAANLRDRTTHTGNESTLPFSEVSEPSAPASGLTVYSESVAGRQMLAQVPKAGRAYPFQPHIGMMNLQMWLPNANANTSTILGQVAPSATGTATARTVTTTNNFTWQRRIGYVSAATAGSTSGLRSAVLQFGTGNNTGTGGFYFQTRFGISDAALVANARSAIGLTATTTAFTNADPSSFANFVGMAHDAADTNWQIMYNDGAGAATKVDLGANFTRSPTVSTAMYDLILYCAPNTTTIFYEVKNIANGAVQSGSFNTNIPANTQLLTWQLWRSNNATAAAVGLDIAIVYIETE